MWDTLARYYSIDWVGAVASLASIYLLGNRVRSGFVLGVVGTILWIAMNVLAASVAGVLLSVFLLALCARGYWKWRNDAPGVSG